MKNKNFLLCLAVAALTITLFNVVLTFVLYPKAEKERQAVEASVEELQKQAKEVYNSICQIQAATVKVDIIPGGVVEFYVPQEVFDFLVNTKDIDCRQTVRAQDKAAGAIWYSRDNFNVNVENGYVLCLEFHANWRIINAEEVAFERNPVPFKCEYREKALHKDERGQYLRLYFELSCGKNNRKITWTDVRVGK